MNSEWDEIGLLVPFFFPFLPSTCTRTPSNTMFLEPQVSALQTGSQFVQPFCRAQERDRHTHHATGSSIVTVRLSSILCSRKDAQNSFTYSYIFGCWKSWASWSVEKSRCWSAALRRLERWSSNSRRINAQSPSLDCRPWYVVVRR